MRFFIAFLALVPFLAQGQVAKFPSISVNATNFSNNGRFTNSLWMIGNESQLTIGTPEASLPSFPFNDVLPPIGNNKHFFSTTDLLNDGNTAAISGYGASVNPFGTVEGIDGSALSSGRSATAIAISGNGYYEGSGGTNMGGTVIGVQGVATLINGVIDNSQPFPNYSQTLFCGGDFHVVNVSTNSLDHACSLDLEDNWNTSTGTVTNNVGVFVRGRLMGIHNYALYTMEGTNVLGDSLYAAPSVEHRINFGPLETDMPSAPFGGTIPNIGDNHHFIAIKDLSDDAYTAALTVYGASVNPGSAVEGIDVASYSVASGGSPVGGTFAAYYDGGTNTANVARGFQAFGQILSGTAPISAGVFGINVSSGAIVPTGVAVEVLEAFNDGGSINNLYGIKVADQTAGTNNWAIKTGVGLNDFGDSVKAPRILFGTNILSFSGTSLTWNGQAITVP